jgi:hypothetical protein
MSKEKFGPTGRFPTGSPQYEWDRGEIRSGLFLDRKANRLLLYFGKVLDRAVMTKAEALEFARALNERAAQMRDD